MPKQKKKNYGCFLKDAEGTIRMIKAIAKYFDQTINKKKKLKKISF